MFKVKLALIVAVGLFVHTPRDWSHANLPRPQQSERLSGADLFTLRVAVRLAGRKGLGAQAALAATSILLTARDRILQARVVSARQV
jgi:hypothetical protein